MPAIKITLSDIEFRNHQGQLDLATPKYHSLINYDLVNENAQSRLQVEPAFQVISLPPDSDSTCVFEFHIKDTEPVDFTIIKSKLELRTLIGPEDVNSWIQVDLAEEKTCQLRVYVKDWNDHIRAVRIHCNHTTAPGKSRSDHGLTLIILRPNSALALEGKRSEPALQSDLNIRVIGFSEQQEPFAKYNIFKYHEDFPEGISIEPAFRTGCQRPLANVSIEMEAAGKAFEPNTATDDDIKVIKRNSPRPAELSKVVLDRNIIRFTYDTTGIVGNIGDPVRFFSFMVEVGNLAPAMVGGSTIDSLQVASSSDAGDHSSRAALPPTGPCFPSPRRPKPRPQKVYVDPILVHEPPPMGVP